MSAMSELNGNKFKNVDAYLERQEQKPGDY